MIACSHCRDRQASIGRAGTIPLLLTDDFVTAPLALQLRSWHLFFLAVLIWGTTWHAIIYQLAEAPAEFGVALRFTLAGLLAFAWGLRSGQPLGLSGRGHLLVATQGLLMYSVSYLGIYHAERFVPSGLVAVGYSASPLMLGLAARLLWGTPLSPSLMVGGVMGVLGVVLIFWPELSHAQADSRTAWGAALTAAAVLVSTAGNVVASRNKAAGLPFWTSMGWGMWYGAAVMWIIVAVSGQWPTQPLTELSLAWGLSLAYLTCFGTVIAFACYLALQNRLGLARTGTIGVATPLVAMVMSIAYEGYRPHWISVVGIAMTLAGSTLALGLWSRTHTGE